jgi:hypothetical protein
VFKSKSSGDYQSQSINKVPTQFDVNIKGNCNDFFAARGADIAILTNILTNILTSVILTILRISFTAGTL